MARYLSIVETPYRATLEEQDDTGVWFTRAIRGAGASVALLLRGDGVSYAQRGQDAAGLRFGSRSVRVPPQLDRDVADAAAAGIAVYVVREDLAARGIPEAALLPGLELVGRADVARLVGEHERVLAW
jgi:predicted peroxiredoxin